MLYLASPYSHPDETIRHTRFMIAEQVCAKLMRERHWVHSPIVHCHELSKKYGLPGDFEYWKDYNISMIRRCDEFWVLAIPGWEESKGLNVELDFARSAFIPVTFCDDVGRIIDEPR